MSQILIDKFEKLNKNQQDLLKLRHTTEHILHTVMQNMYPELKKAMGPATEEGFYFDFELDDKISEKDFPKIETAMKKIIAADIKMVREIIPATAAKKIFQNNPYKLDWIKSIISRGEEIIVYKMVNQQGKVIDLDLCSGPHLRSTGQVKVFKLLSIAGAYWHGDEKNKMLTRIYGTAFSNTADLDKYLWLQEEARKRDHRKLGKELDLFIVSSQVGGGLPLFTPKGMILRKCLENFLTELKIANGYEFVWTPHIARSQIYHTSGHWGKYEAMFNPMKLDDEEYVLKPMNCPHHFQLYLRKQRSYKDLPLRIAENGTVYRFEKSGELNGLLRVRSVTIDDTHTFIRLNQTQEELQRVLLLIKKVFAALGFTDYHARISVHDPQTPDKYLGQHEEWLKAEEALKRSALDLGYNIFIGVGEAAFYGPKIDIMVKDSLARQWQLSTVQLDYNQPHNFKMTYINEQGVEEYPAILHIAMVGSIERLIGILIEHYAGNFPLWLSPVQITLIPISERHLKLCHETKNIMASKGIRTEIDDRNEPMQAKIRDLTLQKVPFMGIIGDQEVEKSNKEIYLSVRDLQGKNFGLIRLYDFINKLTDKIEKNQ